MLLKSNNRPPQQDSSASDSQPAQASDTSPEEQTTSAPEPQTQKIKIGSQRSDDSAQYSAKPQVAAVPLPKKDDPVSDEEASRDTSSKAPLSVPSGISVKAALTEDLEREVEEALGSGSINEMMEDGARSAEQDFLEKGKKLRARILKIHSDNVFVDIKQPYEGVLSLRQFKDDPKIGEFIDVRVTGFKESEGLYQLTIPEAAVEAGDWSELAEGMVLEAYIEALNKGGLQAKVGNIRAFIPASQVAIVHVEDLSEFLGQKLNCLVTECKPNKKNLVLSRRAILERERQEAKEKLLKTLEVGQTHDGVVRTVKDFGAFIDLGGVDGLLPVSQLSWTRVKHPKDVVSPGQKVQVKIQSLDKDTGKMSLSMRDLLENPWDLVEQNYPPNSNVKGKVTKLLQFGALVALEGGIEGMIHISELAHKHVPRVSDVVKEGDQIEVQVLTVDKEKQRIALSLKATQAVPVSEKSAKGY